MLLSKWFSSEIYQIFTPFLVIIPYGILFLLAIGFGVGALVVLFKRIKKERFSAALPLIIFVCIGCIYLFVSFTLPKVKVEHAIFAEKRETIVKAIQNNEYKDDGIGNIKLPSDCWFLSCDGEVHVYQNDEEGIVVGFWSYRGLLMSRFQSVIYTSYAEPPENSLKYCVVYETEKLDDNWYWVLAY